MASEFSEIIASLHESQSVDLSYFGVLDLAQLTDALKTNTSVSHLVLGKNKIGAEGAAAIAEVLKVPTTAVAYFDVSCNELGD